MIDSDLGDNPLPPYIRARIQEVLMIRATGFGVSHLGNESETLPHLTMPE